MTIRQIETERERERERERDRERESRGKNRDLWNTTIYIFSSKTVSVQDIRAGVV